jgi:hypothetical protein
MSDELPPVSNPTTSPLPESPVLTPEPSLVAPPASRVGRLALALSILALLGVVLVGVAVARLYFRPQPAPVAAVAPTPDLTPQVAALQTDIAAVKQQVVAADSLAHRTADQIAALSASAPPTAAPPVAVNDMDPDLRKQIAALAARLDRASQTAQQANAGPSASEVATLASRLDAIAQRQAQDGQSSRQDSEALQKQVADLVRRTNTLSTSGEALPKLAARTDRLAALMRAQEDLRLGQPIGTLPGAPTSLSRFANAAPPTEASLRLSYVDAARKAGAVARPAPAAAGFWDRIWFRVSDLVVIRRGDQVIVGDPAAGVLAHAGRQVDAGDIAGALATLKVLPAATAAAMAGWEAQAQSLVDARAALVQMAAG